MEVDRGASPWRRTSAWPVLKDLRSDLTMSAELATAMPRQLRARADDEWIVASAVEGGADVLVTGDAAVLKIAQRAPLRIVNPRGLWDLLRGSEPSK